MVFIIFTFPSTGGRGRRMDIDRGGYRRRNECRAVAAQSLHSLPFVTATAVTGRIRGAGEVWSLLRGLWFFFFGKEGLSEEGEMAVCCCCTSVVTVIEHERWQRLLEVKMMKRKTMIRRRRKEVYRRGDDAAVWILLQQFCCCLQRTGDRKDRGAFGIKKGDGRCW